MKEGNVINKSLSTLGKVMTALAERSAKASQHIPYRESVLTWLLRESLGGNSKTLMMAAISPSLDNFEETLSTLRYANQAKRIVNVAVVNEDANTIMLRKLTEEIDSLRTLLAGGGTGSSSSSIAPLLPVTVEQAEQLAAQREQLAESEKLLRTMNESWEEKLAKTKSMQQARLDQLRAQGILLSQDGDAAVPLGVMAPQRTPYLLNIGRTVGQQCLVYYLHPGDTPVMPFTSAAAAHAQVHTPAPGGQQGDPAAAAAAILLPGCEENHCVFQCSAPPDGTTPMETVLNIPARESTVPVLLNGVALLSGATMTLRSGDTVKLAQSTFRYAAPGVAAFPTPQKIAPAVSAIATAAASAASSPLATGLGARGLHATAGYSTPVSSRMGSNHCYSSTAAAPGVGAGTVDSPETPLPPTPPIADANDNRQNSAALLGALPTSLDLGNAATAPSAAMLADNRPPSVFAPSPVSTPRSTAAAEVTASWAKQASPLDGGSYGGDDGGGGGSKGGAAADPAAADPDAANIGESNEEPATPAPPRRENSELAKRLRDTAMCHSTTRPLPAVNVSREDEQRFLAHLAENMQSSRFVFALMPAYGLYMMVHSQRRSPQALLQASQERIASRLEAQVALACSANNVNELAMLLANTSELLAALRTDDALIPTSGAAQVTLTGCVQETFAALLEQIKRRCRNSVSSILKDGRAALADLPRSSQAPATASSAGKVAAASAAVAVVAAAALPDASIDFLIESLDAMHQLLEHSLVPKSLRVQLYEAIFHHIGTTAFNQLLADGDKEKWYRWDRGLSISYNLAQLLDWATDREMNLEKYLAHTSQAARLLQLNKSSLANLDPLCEAANLLNSLQIERLLRKYKPGRGEPKVPPELIDCMRGRAMHGADVLAAEDEMVQCKLQLFRDPNYALPFRLCGPFHIDDGLHDAMLVAEAKSYLDAINLGPPALNAASAAATSGGSDACGGDVGEGSNQGCGRHVPSSYVLRMAATAPLLSLSAAAAPPLRLPPDMPQEERKPAPSVERVDRQSSLSRWLHGEKTKVRPRSPVVSALSWVGLQ